MFKDTLHRLKETKKIKEKQLAMPLIDLDIV